MARLLRPEDYAVLVALFGILILESISSQVIQSATAKLAAQYRAFAGATAAVGVSLLVAIVPLAALLSAARGATHEVELGAAETRFFALAAVVLLAYAALTNIDAVLARSLLPPDDAGAYAGAVTLGKIVLFAPIAIGYLLLERTSRAHARGEDTDRALGLALA